MGTMTIIPVLQMTKSRCGENQQVAQGHTGQYRPAPESGPGPLALGPASFLLLALALLLLGTGQRPEVYFFTPAGRLSLILAGLPVKPADTDRQLDSPRFPGHICTLAPRPITTPFLPTDLVILPEGIPPCLPYSYHGDTNPETTEIITSTLGAPQTAVA